MFGKDGPTLRELIEQALSSTERGYDLLAPKFDTTPFRTPDAVLTRALADLGEVDDALDLGCGTGAAMLALRPQVRRRLTGVDLSQGMLDVARQRIEACPGPARVELVHQDFFALDAVDAFDLVTCFGAFGHVPEEAEPRFVRLVRRALRPGGRFVFVTARPPGALSLANLAARGFNAAMRLRNAFVDPPFVMFYLTFLLPEAARLLRWEGFDVEIDEGRFEAPYGALARVLATKR